MSRKGSGFSSSDFEELDLLDDNGLVGISRSLTEPQRARRAVSMLIFRYLPLVKKKARAFSGDRAETEDLAQEGFLAFLNAVRSFDESRGAKFSSFAEVCVTNGIKNAVLKMGKNAEESLSDGFEEKIGDVSDPENICFEKEKTFAIYSEIASLLSKKEWSIFKLYLDGLSYKEISERLGIPPKAVDNAVFRVKKKLRALFSQDKIII